MIAIAAFAVTASSVQAFNDNVVRKAGLSEDQVAAFAVARELSREGDILHARDILLDAGIDEATIDKLRRALHEYRQQHPQSVAVAKQARTFADFQVAVADTPLADIVLDETTFLSYKNHQAKRQMDRSYRIVDHQTNQLDAAQAAAFQVARQANDVKAARAIMEEAGLVTPSLERHWQNTMKRRQFDS